MTTDEVRELIREGKARNAADPHGSAYFVPVGLRDGAARCNCGWLSKVSTPGRANAALQRHQATVRRDTPALSVFERDERQRAVRLFGLDRAITSVTFDSGRTITRAQVAS